MIPLDALSFEELFRSNFKPLCILAIRYVKDSDVAKDIVQEVFFNAWEKKDAIDLSKSVKTYLSASVRNRCLNYIRDNRKFNDADIEKEHYAEHPEFNSPDRLSEEELKKRIRMSIEELPEKCREVFVLNRFENLKYLEIADKLGISVKTVETQMSKALKHMRTRLSEFLSLLLLITSHFPGMKFFNLY